MGTPPLRLRVLGGFHVAVGDRPVPESAWRLRKAKSLIKLLALAPDRRLHRERVAELLWPDRTADSAANNLHQALYVARRALEAAGADALACLALRDDMLVLCEERPVTIDAADFEAAAVTARAEGTIQAYRDALAHYGGELLPEDRFEDWVTSRREALGELHLALLMELAERHLDAGDEPGAVEALQQAVVDDPLHEEVHRRLMRLFAASGRRQQALAQYQQLRQTLRREYEADPDPETRRVYQDILAGRLESAPPAGASTEARPPGARRDAATPDGARMNNLPVSLTSFIGRGRELTEVRRQLDRTRLLTLTGPGGAGKTRLALEVAAERLRQFEDGVWLVELASLADPDLVAQETAIVLGMRLGSHPDADAVLARLIGERRLMLVLDNCEHLIGACARLAEQLLRACPELTVLATSREPLRIAGEVALRVPSLALPDPDVAAPGQELMRFEAIRLFAERAADAAPGFHLTDDNASDVAEVCFRLDGMPLAIELAAARAGVLTPAQIAQRLRDSLRPARRRPRAAHPPADARGHPELEPRPSHPRGAGALPPHRRVRRVVRARRGRGGVRRRPAWRAARWSSCSGAWSTSRSWRPRRNAASTATGCSRRSANTLAIASARRARRHAWRRTTATGTSPWPKPPTRTWRASASSSARSSISTTCARRWHPGCATIPDAPCAWRWRCGRCG